MIRFICRALDSIAALAVVALCLLIVANVVSRQFFAQGLPDVVILVRELMVPAILFPLSSATATRAHVAIEFIAQFLPAAFNRWVAVFAGLIGLGLAVMLIIAGWEQLSAAWRTGSHYSGAFDVPKWPSRLSFVIAVGFFALNLALVLAQDVKAAVTGRPAPDTL